LHESLLPTGLFAVENARLPELGEYWFGLLRRRSRPSSAERARARRGAPWVRRHRPVFTASQDQRDSFGDRLDDDIPH
jgi:hypothetical protein